MKKRKIISAFKLEHPILVVICIVILLLIYSVCCTLEKQEDVDITGAIIEATINGEKFELETNHPIRDLIKDTSIILISVLASSLVSTALVSKKEYDKIYSEAFEDVISQSTVQIKLPEKNKSDVTLKLEKEFEKNYIPKEIFDTAIEKIAAPDLPYYYEECTIDVSCQIENDIFIKTISKELHIRAYEDHVKYSQQSGNEHFVIAKQSGEDGIPTPLKIKKFVIYNKSGKGYDETNSIRTSQTKCNDQLYQKNGYTVTNTAYLIKDITLQKNQDTHLAIEYETRTSLNDLTYVFRVPCACKKFTFKFRIDDENYHVTGHAFGFFDDANQTFNPGSNNSLCFTFENWIFKRDGICVNIVKNKVNS